jgi:hypothetical protein
MKTWVTPINELSSKRFKPFFLCSYAGFFCFSDGYENGHLKV